MESLDHFLPDLELADLNSDQQALEAALTNLSNDEADAFYAYLREELNKTDGILAVLAHEDAKLQAQIVVKNQHLGDDEEAPVDAEALDLLEQSLANIETRNFWITYKSKITELSLAVVLHLRWRVNADLLSALSCLDELHLQLMEIPSDEIH